MKKVEKKVWDSKKIKWFTETTEKWLKKCYLTDWIILYKFEEKNSDEWDDVLATTNSDSTYHEAEIKFFPTILKASSKWWSSEYVEWKIKHEVCHMITEKISDLALNRHTTKKEIDDEIETLTQKISIIIT